MFYRINLRKTIQLLKKGSGGGLLLFLHTLDYFETLYKNLNFYINLPENNVLHLKHSRTTQDKIYAPLIYITLEKDLPWLFCDIYLFLELTLRIYNFYWMRLPLYPIRTICNLNTLISVQVLQCYAQNFWIRYTED